MVCLLFAGSPTVGQIELKGRVVDEHSEEPLANVNIVIEGSTRGTITDASGYFNLELPAGTYLLRFHHIGYAGHVEEVILDSAVTLTIVLEEIDHEGEAVTISSTRLSRTIDDTPTRVETIAGEELDEKSSMRSSDIRMQLNESTGIQVQQTSATSANAGFRMQGLDGRYTLLLKDGFPLYSGFSSGLSILHIPPLDLKQIEIIKGSASTLYGGGAIAGLINLISREPEDDPVTSAMLNVTTAGGQDVSVFTARKNSRTAYSIFASGHLHAAYDANSDDFSDIPRVRRVTLNPKLYFNTSDADRLMIGIQSSAENRKGGDIDLINGSNDSTHIYLETNESTRLSLQGEYRHAWSSSDHLTIRSSVMRFDRTLRLPGYEFKGVQHATFSEALWTATREDVDFAVGSNLMTDRFDQRRNNALDFSQTTLGLFLQTQVRVSPVFSIESGVRADHVDDYGWFLLPRAYGLFQFGPQWSSRLGGGMGYKVPSVFNETSEETGYQNLRPLSGNEKSERSIGVNGDVNYKGTVGDVIGVNVNQLFFYTRIEDPLTFDPDSVSNGVYRLVNRRGNFRSRGMESNLRLSYKDVKFLMGYTFIDAHLVEGGTSTRIPLVARHRLGLVLIYEVEHVGRIGLETYYTGRQRRSDQSATRSYWVTGIMAERQWKRFSLFLNLENLFDTRQSRYERLFDGTRQQPDFREIYAPVDGFVANGGVKVRL